MRYTANHYIKALTNALREKSDRESERIWENMKKVLRTNGDERLTPAILRGALQYVRREKNQRTARIVSAALPTEKEKGVIKNSFPAEEYVFEINKNIIGGMVIQKGTRLYNATVRHALKQLEFWVD